MKEGARLGTYDLLYGVALAESYHMLTAREVREGMTEERRNRLVRAYVNNNFKHHVSHRFPVLRVSGSVHAQGKPISDSRRNLTGVG